MKYSKIAVLISAMLITTGISGVTHAEGLYGTALIGKSSQATDSEPYGNNIAVDPDFPQTFDSGDGSVGTIGVGYSYNNNIRVEGRLSYRNGDFNDRKIGTGQRVGEEYILNGEIKSTSLTLEGFYDFTTTSKLKPYIKAGVGVSRNRYAARLGGAGVAAFDAFDGVEDGFYDAYADKKSTDFTWNVGLGATYAINKKINLVAEYQYISLGDGTTGQDSFTDGFQVDGATANEFQLGIQVNF